MGGFVACKIDPPSATTSEDAGTTLSDAADLAEAGSDASPEWTCTYAHTRLTPPAFEGVPEGWIQPPCVRSNCPVVIAPEPSLMGPPPVWTECGPGCLEHIEEPGDGYIGIDDSGILATKQGGKRYLAYTSGFRREPGGPGTHMLQKRILRLPDNTVTFDMLWLKGLNNDGCWGYIEALHSTTALVVMRMKPPGVDDFKSGHRVVFTMSPEGGPLDGVFERTDDLLDVRWTVSSSLWTVAFGYASFEWHDMSPSNELKRAWTTPDGSLLLANMKPVGDDVFFGTNRIGRSYQIFTFHPRRGTQPLVAPASVQEGGACWLDTDGTDLAWLEGKGWLGEKYRDFSERYLMTSKFATNASELKPRVLRRVSQYHLDGCSGVVGGGYVLSQEVELPSRESRLILTRIEDGAFWELEPPEGFAWARVLYVDEEEFAVIKYRLIGESGMGFHSIVRQSIAALGEPKPASMFVD